MNIIQVSQHKISPDGSVDFISEPGTRVEEICHSCGAVITYYVEGPSLHTNLTINKEYLESWFDLVIGDILYHTCSPKCKEMLRFAPPIT